MAMSSKVDAQIDLAFAEGGEVAAALCVLSPALRTALTFELKKKLKKLINGRWLHKHRFRTTAGMVAFIHERSKGEAAVPKAAQEQSVQEEAAQDEAAQDEAAHEEAAQEDAVQEEVAVQDSGEEAAAREAATEEAAPDKAATDEAATEEAAEEEADERHTFGIICERLGVRVVDPQVS